MSPVTCQLSTSLDGFVAGPNQSIETPMGRKMFHGGAGPWDETWRGWWGEDPPYHAPVFVLTHHPREPLQMQGGTTFPFVTGGIESALEQAGRRPATRTSRSPAVTHVKYRVFSEPVREHSNP